MANVDRPSGFRPSGKVRDAKPYVAGGTIYPGDAVTMNASGQVVAAAATETLLGVAAEKAVTGEKVLVWDDPDQEFKVQADTGTSIAAADVGLNADIVATAGDTTYDRSRMELDSSSKDVTGTLQLRIVGISTEEGNAAGEHAKCIVTINKHQLAKGSVGL